MRFGKALLAGEHPLDVPTQGWPLATGAPNRTRVGALDAIAIKAWPIVRAPIANQRRACSSSCAELSRFCREKTKVGSSYNQGGESPSTVISGLLKHAFARMKNPNGSLCGWGCVRSLSATELVLQCRLELVQSPSRNKPMDSAKKCPRPCTLQAEGGVH